MTLSQSTLASLEDQKSMCIMHIETLSAKMLDAEERLAYLNAEIRKLRGARDVSEPIEVYSVHTLVIGGAV